ncbi:TolC family protein [Candidatus Persebacteraceae bacterium Df01]|jgi:outer membrane protein TolC|uniref:TolC family protein n=1 Tax=Candidatus Doriopsillibacter californiensis TaxID=2970740 RepID=A0ABT7QL84_9GAMM|nr:TolC family protein [Candidatus Persebacteraceae bacterium Df01]
MIKIRRLAQYCIFALIMLVSAPPPLAQESADKSASLTRLMQLAIENNAMLAAQRAQLAAASETDDIAKAGLLPQLNMGVERPVHSDFSARKNRTFMSLSQQLFNLPLKLNYESALWTVRVAESIYLAQEQNLQLSVIAAWLDLQQASDLVRLTETRFTVARTQLTRAEAFAEAGAGTRVDVLEAQAFLARVRADLLQYQQDEELAQDALRELTALRGQRMRLTGKESNFPLLAAQDDWLLRVQQGSHLVAAARAELEADVLLSQSAKTALFPRLSISARTEASGSLDNHREEVVLALEQSLYSGGEIWAKHRRLKQNIIVARENLRAVEDNIIRQSSRLHRQATAARAQAEAFKSAEASSAAALEAEETGYANGVRTAADVLDAEEALFDTRLQLRRARYDYLRHIAGLFALSGELDDDFVIQLENLFNMEREENH